MATKQRSDLLVNIPALRKLDAMLLVRTHAAIGFISHPPMNITFSPEYLSNDTLRKQDCLDNFKDQSEFTYVDFKDANEAEKATGKRDNDKWWIPTVRIPPGGLSDETKRWLQHQKDAVNQVLKAAMAINAQVLSEMEIPESYIESLPKVLQ